jgi:UDP-glucose 4-epimerase
MANVVVTGGAGFIGSNLVDALLARGDRVHVIDNLASGKRENLTAAVAAGVVLHELDVCDGAGVERVFAQAAPEFVFHLAAQIDVRASVTDPGFDASVNVLGAINLLEAARRHRVTRVVYSSTGGALYGDADVLPTPEDHPIRPLAAYGQSKYAAEGYFDLYCRLYGISALTLRYGNVYGPRQDVHGEAGVVAIFCGRLIAGQVPVVFGDGLQTRDWVDVSDVVAANLLAAGSGFEGALNIGHGQETSVLGFIEALQKVGREFDFVLPDPVHEAARLGEVRRSCLDVSAAKQHLGWAPQVSLEQGLSRILSGLATQI